MNWNTLLIDESRLERLIRLAIEEDVGMAGDITSRLLPSVGSCRARLVVKHDGIVAGLMLVEKILKCFNSSLRVESVIRDGQNVRSGETIGVIAGDGSSILTCERTLLNFLQRLSGIATLTQQFVEAAKGTSAEIYDTRKTTPGWRDLEKYAVRCGGGRNHRHGLHDAILVKDNHLSQVPTNQIADWAQQCIDRIPTLGIQPEFVEFEVDTLDQMEQLLAVRGIDIILLDNFTIPDLLKAVALRNRMGLKSRIALEASGGVTLETVHAIAETGMDRISVGALTHSAVALDISMEMQ